MSELTGAVALAQFGKLDTIVSRMRANKRRVKDGIAELAGKGVEFREVTDAAGDTAVCLIFYLPEARLRKFQAMNKGYNLHCFL